MLCRVDFTNATPSFPLRAYLLLPFSFITHFVPLAFSFLSSPLPTSHHITFHHVEEMWIPAKAGGLQRLEKRGSEALKRSVQWEVGEIG